MVFDYSTLIPHIQRSTLRAGIHSSIQLQNNPMFEGYDNKNHDWIDIFERKAKQQLKLGNRDGYQSYLKIKNALETTLDR